MSNLQPLRNRILVKREAESKTGSFHIPIAFQRDQTVAVVVRVGTGRVTRKGVRIPLEVVAGDMVVIEEHRGQEILENGVLLTLLNGEDVLAILPHESSVTV